MAIAGRAWYALPLLNLGQDDVDELGKEVKSIVVLHRGCGGDKSAFTQAPTNDIVACLVRLGAHIGDGLQNHAGDMQVGTVLLGFGRHRVHDNLCDFGYVAEGARLVEQAQHLALASRAAQGPVLEVGRGAGPFAQTLLVLRGAVTRGIVLVGEGEQVRGDGALVRLLKAWQAEGAWLEESRRGI